MDRVAILGCGAMGTVMGAFMAKNGLVVDMVDAYKAHVDALNQNGAHIIGKEEFTVPVKALLPEDMEGIYDLVFLLTKQTANEVVLKNLLPHLGPDSVVCTIQNGVPEPFVAKLVGEERTVGGTIQWGATFIEPGVSELTTDLKKKIENGRAFFDIGEINGEITDRVNKIADVLRYMGGPVDVVENLMDIRWRKLVINSCGSGMSAACGSPFGPVIDDERGLECMAMIGYEVALCAKAAGYELSDAQKTALVDPAEKGKKFFRGVYVNSPQGKASMLQDLEAGRITEVDMINGYICETGDKYGIDTPYNDAVVSIVHRMEKGELPLSLSNLQYFPEIRY